MVQSIDDARRRQQRIGRVPPHNLEAEESLLGAMLLSGDAIAAAVNIHLSAEDFYKPAHGHVYDAICSLYAQGEPVDPVTVAEELRRADLHDLVGGLPALLSLEARTPATSSASRYARIVEDHALLRRLIGVAGEIAEVGYDLPDDVAMAIDRAEAMVYEVAQKRVTDSMVGIGPLLEQSLDHIEALYERGEEITGIPTGYTDLDEILAGLQPSNLVIVGARPAMGKALALDTPIATPDGWATMGEITVGSEVFDEQGQPCRVTYVSPTFVDHDCYEVSFDDGSKLVADAAHQWFAYDFPAWKSHRALSDRLAKGPCAHPTLARDQSNRKLHPRVVTTKQMHDEGVRHRDERPNWYLPLAAPIECPDVDLPVDPYVLGCWLGDGSGSSEHAPSTYLRSSIKQRLALLQGLLDTRGTVNESTGAVTLCLADERLLDQARELACSLGHKPGPVKEKKIRLPDGRATLAWAFTWTPLDPVFRLPRKAGMLSKQQSHRRNGRHTRRHITDIRPVPSVPARCIAVDSPNHLYLAGKSMIPTHNTSMALGMASHAAMHAHRPVLVFSLEMSHLELTQRLLCAEARVDASRLRTGRLQEPDWPKISHAVGRLGEANIYIDDNPHLTVMEIRAKARRLKSRLGDLGLIVVDYLQLMTGRPDAENRQVEVSEISRGLKILARELECPVVGLSQLSRQLETRADKRPMLADLRESGCLTADTRVLRADTGAEVTMGELFLSGETDIPVWSLDEDLKLVESTMTHVFPTGIKPVFDLRLASGRVVRASANHPFLTLDGWTRLDELSVGRRIAVPRRVPRPTQSENWPTAEVVMLAHLIGDGCVAPRQPVHYTSTDIENIEAVEDAATHFGISPRRVRQENWWHVYLPAPFHLTHGRRNPIQAWLAGLGLDYLRSYEKFVPGQVFALSDEQVALFLRHLWATDGSLGVFAGQGRINYSSTSERLARDLQRLLLRFEILSSIHRVDQDPHRPAYQLQVAGAENQRRFVDRIGVHGARAAYVPRLREHIDQVTRHPYSDSVPIEIWERVRPVAAVAGMSASRVAAGAEFSQGNPYRSAPSRDRLGRVATLLGDENLRRLATSDVSWDHVVAIESRGEEPVYDATVVDTHNFVANGIVVENSLEQDADVVLFIYRDEVYNPESADRGAAEIIVAKHRNGPTGSVQLAFVDRYTLFANMAKGV